MSNAVSVIIPTRDRGGLLVEAVRSALAASRQPLEIIVVDAGSTDGSIEAVSELGSSVRTIRGTFRNAAVSRNAGAAEAAGEYLGFLDSDDLLLPGKTTCLVEALSADSRAGLVHGTTEVIGERGESLSELTTAQNASFAKARKIGTSYAALAGFCAMFTSATLIRKRAFDEIGGYDESLDAYEDWDLYLRLALDWQLTYANCLAARYRIWSGNVGWQRTAQWTIRVAEKHLGALPALAEDEQRNATYGFLRQLAWSHHVLVDRVEARRFALGAVRSAPGRALRDRDVRRPLWASWLPTRLLEARRPDTPA